MKRVLLFLFISLSFAQIVAQKVKTQPNRTKVDFLQANDWNYNETKVPGAQVITGDVIFRHDSTYLYCDTAYFYKEKNSIEAFGNVRMEQGDTLFVYGDFLYYDGNTKMARLRRNVRMESLSLKDKENAVTLLTDSFNYDRALNLAYFFEGGVVIDKENELSSAFGQYNPASKNAIFQYEVKLKNPKMNLFSDTLVYNTVSKIATILGPSKILSDSTTILSHRGWYNTQLETSMLLDSTSIHNKGTLMTGDSIFYDRVKGYSEVFGHMYVNDTIQKTILKGNYGYYDEIKEYSMVTDSALCVDYSTKDTLYIHADTLKAYTVWGNNPIPNKRMKTTEAQKDSIVQSRDTAMTYQSYAVAKADTLLAHPVDSTAFAANSNPGSDSLANKRLAEPQKVVLDTIYKQVIGYYGVRAYGTRMQAVCDSMALSSKDSIINMYTDPIVWSDNYQLFGEFIQVYMNDSTIEKAHVQGYVFACQNRDSIHFDQVAGKEMYARFDSLGDLRRIDVSGNVLTIYYPEDSKDSSLIGMVKCESSFLEMELQNRKMQRIKMYPETTGIMKPMENLTTRKIMYLDRFVWYDYIRPMSRDDIFVKRVKKITDSQRNKRK
ncbi:MAG: OstA-like protein [Bacteroidales bacterium]|jgi:lipopolysaccharide export system protein LptA|nr:OstA-like protein [Bacteroidales bacterium]